MGNEKRPQKHGGSVLLSAPATVYPAGSWCSRVYSGVYPRGVYGGCVYGCMRVVYGGVESGRLKQ